MQHTSVLLSEAVEQLKIKPDGIYVDGTLGGAGHSKAILNQLSGGFLFAFDQDTYAINYAKNVLKDYKNYEIIHANFRKISTELKQRNIDSVDGILLDLGLSSFQIDDQSRGFTYLKETTLDMRMNQDQILTAEMIVNTYSVEELARIFYLYGEEKNSFKIAKAIVEKRPLDSTMDLVRITDRINFKEKGHSAKRVFQALRIAVNDELGALEDVLEHGVKLLKPGGRMVIITFHSLEDRIVKHYFKAKSSVDIPKNLPIQHLPEADYVTINTKPIYPGEDEMKENARSKSAKMRVLERRKS